MANIQDYLDRTIVGTPKQRIGIGGFTAFVTIEEKTIRSADIPTTIVEDGSFVNDHIILNQVALSIQGDVSDVYIERSPTTELLTRAQAEIGAVTQYAPPRTQAQVQQVNSLINDLTDAVRRVDALLNTGQQVLSYFGNKDRESKTNRELFIDAMESIYYGKQLISIDTQYRRWNNMVLTLVETTDNNVDGSTRFSIEAREFRLASTIFTEIKPAANPSIGLGGQADPESAKGVQEGTPADSSLLFTLIGR